MDKSFSVPEYVDKEWQRIKNSPAVQDALKEAVSKIDENKSEPKEIEDEDKIMFRLWAIDQFKRYEKVKESVEPYMKAQGKILPAEPIDFMHWFVKFAKKTDDYLDVKIEHYHFELFHEERVHAMKKPAQWEGLYKELSDAGYIKSNLEVFNHVMENKHLIEAKDRILWLTSKADALDILSNFKFTMPQFNKCFLNEDEKPFTLGAKTTGYPHRNEALSIIIEKYKPLSGE